MARRGLELGEMGETQLSPQVQDGAGRWVTTDQPRKAQQWRARAYYRGYDGVRRDASVTARKRGDAEQLLSVIVAERLRGAGDGEMTPTTPLVDAGRIYLRHVGRAESGLSARTVADYTAAFNRCVDRDGSILRGLTITQANDPQRLRAFLREVADTRGTGAAKMVRSALSGTLNLAVKNGTIPSNALRQVRVVRSESARKDSRDHSRAFTRAERDAVIAHADSLVPRVGEANPRTVRKAQATADLLAFMAGTGARIDEVRALRWDDLAVDLTSAHLRGTKSGSADRNVNLPSWLTDRLHRRAGESPAGLVFPSPAHLDTERRWDQSNNAAAVRAVLDGAGMGWAVPHTFRRTVASILHEAGAPLVRIADQLGHSDPAMTARVYLGRDLAGDKSDLAGHL